MWVRVDDGLPEHAKLYAAGQALGRDGMARVIALVVAGLCYAARNLTDGFLPAQAVDGMRQVRDPLQVADALVSAGLWIHEADGFRIHDYHDYNPKASVVKERRAYDRSRKESRRNPSGHTPESYRNPECIRGTGTGSGSSLEDRARAMLETADREISTTRVVLEAAELVQWFERVYAAYPNKDRKLAANQKWVELAPDLSTAQAILANIQRRKREGWVRFERRFIPHLVRFLDERQWEDLPEPGPIYEEQDALPHAWTCAACGEIHEGTAEQARARRCPVESQGRPKAEAR